MDFNKVWYGLMAITIVFNLFVFLVYGTYERISGATAWVVTYVLLVLVYRYEYGGRGLG